MGSNQGGDTSPTERVGTRVGTATTPANSSSTIFRKASHKPEDKDKGSEENKQFDRRRKREKPPLWNAAVMVSFSFFWGERWAVGCPLLVLRVSCLCVSLCLLYSLLYQVIMFSELKNIRGDADQVPGVCNRRPSTFLPINPLKMAKTNNTRFGRIENALG